MSRKIIFHNQKIIYLVTALIIGTSLLVMSPTEAFELPKFPHSIKIIESDTLPIELIKEECTKINAKENVNGCITNTMNHWNKYRRSNKKHPEASKTCYESLKELDDYILVNNCIDASIDK